MPILNDILELVPQLSIPRRINDTVFKTTFLKLFMPMITTNPAGYYFYIVMKLQCNYIMLNGDMIRLQNSGCKFVQVSQDVYWLVVLSLLS